MPICAITLYPYILFADSQVGMSTYPGGVLTPQAITINHESIHIAQYEELWVAGFLFLYLLDYLVGRLKYKYTHNKAYRMIRFEQEAYGHQYVMSYLATRTTKAWKAYTVQETTMGR